MNEKYTSLRMLALPAAALFLLACSDSVVPTEPAATAESRVAEARGPQGANFARPVSEVMGLPQTVFAARDARTGQLVFGIENRGVARAVDRVMAAHGVPSSAYTVRVTEPIRFMTTSLRTEHRPTVGGIQIHWGQYVCTLGFNVEHSGGASFITNSHCTNRQGTTGATLYYQPLSSVNSTSIAVEADDPEYTRFAGCSQGKRCRYSDASRALYHNGTQSSRGVIAKTAGENSGALNTAGSFSITSQSGATSFSGTVHKVGRTTGWTSGNVTSTCAVVNVLGSNIQLHCQTLVQRQGSVIVGGGDSGSPVFLRSSSNDNVELAGILWGGSSSGDLFVFSPVKNIQDELGAFNATTGGSSTPPGNGDGDPPECRPRGNSGNCV